MGPETSIMKPTIRAISILLILCGILAGARAQGTPQGSSIQIQLGTDVPGQAKEGRYYLVFSKEAPKGIPGEPRWFQPDPFFSGKLLPLAKKGEALAFSDQDWKGFPHASLKDLPAGKYWVSGVLDLNLGSRKIFSSPGNLFGKAIAVEIPLRQPVRLILDQQYLEPRFPENAQVKYFEIESTLLTKFLGRRTVVRAAVALPDSYETQAGRKYPAVYEIPGFGGNHYAALNAKSRGKTNLNGMEVAHVVLDPDCPLGHHVFADSANNGPWGQALTQEFIPALEKQFRLIADPRARLVTGHSSGGWSSLWLQVTYPGTFGGVWSTAPDPVDFRDFQKINLYQPGENMFKDRNGQDRPLGRRGDKPFLYYKPFSDMEEALVRGGQLGSFEAVFSPKAVNGLPKKLWNRDNGQIDLETSKAWEAYDIRLQLEKNWPNLANQLVGKIHVYMGDKDTFYLEGATQLLQQSLKKLGSDAVVELFPGKDHSNLLDAAMADRIKAEMAAALSKVR